MFYNMSGPWFSLILPISISTYHIQVKHFHEYLYLKELFHAEY